MSFIILLFALYTISGGILLAGNIHGTPLVNAGLLLAGALLASVIGTTGGPHPPAQVTHWSQALRRPAPPRCSTPGG